MQAKVLHLPIRCEADTPDPEPYELTVSADLLRALAARIACLAGRAAALRVLDEARARVA